ncbi:MAG: LLM class F420-dependent oxidoreductase [Armatimonadota bacterium]|nr:LLM class F420-dependent oxidoreductase [Armatimonadota bacterium]
MMRFSVSVPTCKEGLNMPLPFADEQDIMRIVREAERLGFYAVWGNDHVTAPTYVRQKFTSPPRFYELLMTLAYAAAVTSQIRLGTCIIVLPMREPVYLAKQVATLDHLSGGRVLFGVGVGAYREEFEALHPGLKGADRGRMADESLQCLQLLFSQPRAGFDGQYFRFDGIELYPKPRQSPLPIYVGGNHPNNVRRAVRWGHGWLPASMGVDEVRRGVDLLRREAEAAGRDLAGFDVALQVMVVMGRDEVEARRRFMNTQMYQHLLSLRASTLRHQDVSRLEEYNLIGTRQMILDKIGRLEAAGVTHCASINFLSDTVGGMMESMQQFAEEIVPVHAA